MLISSKGNQILQFNEPWKLQKTDPETVKVVMNLALHYVAVLSTVMRPFLPFTSDKLQTMLNLKAIEEKDELVSMLDLLAAGEPLLEAGHKIGQPTHLFSRIDDSVIAAQKAKLVKLAEEAPVATVVPAEAAPIKDEIAFDDDITVTCVRYTSTANGNPNNPGPTMGMDLVGPWTLADDQSIDANTTDTYCIIFCVDMDLNSAATPGDGNYDACGSNALNDPQAGEGLYNQSSLDLDDDGVAEEVDEACGDLPNVYHEKTATGFVAMPNGNHMVTYELCVYNNGGADGNYDLYDEPIFDDDIEIIQQNPGPFGSSRENYDLMYKDGKWRIDNNQILGWLRK